MEYFALIISAIFVKNILLAQYLGNCPFLGVSRKMDTAIGMGMAVIFVMTLATIITWSLQRYFLEPLNLVYLQTIIFILVIAALVQFVEMFIKKSSHDLYQALGIYLPLITTNCAILGVAIICAREGHTFPQMLVFAVASAVGYSLALILFAGLRERFEISRIPKALSGTAIGLVTAGLMSLAFFSFFGMVA
ncbi:TPA: electron transport complex subunit RsxA [Candidatus Poribacteria bacterium]|nr:electron transport complex subunit RsxA [Candidatus Poribacteria bacterium]